MTCMDYLWVKIAGMTLLISAFHPRPREIVKMSHNKIRIFDFPKVSAFMKYIGYLGFSSLLTKLFQSLT